MYCLQISVEMKNGSKFDSDKMVTNEEDYQNFILLFKNIPKLEYFKVTKGKEEIFFNPKNINSMTIKHCFSWKLLFKKKRR